MNNNEIAIINEQSIKDKIYIIRGEKVMLDFELAEIYGYTTRRFNEQIKRNGAKFVGYMFQLTKDELIDYVMSQNATSRNDSFFKGQSGGTRKLPYAFTESGIYMLMTVLRGKLAVEQSRKLINIFKGMKDYLEYTKQITTVHDIISLTSKVYDHEKRLEGVEDDINKMKDNFIDESKYKEFLIVNGQKFDADIAYQAVYQKAKKFITIIDDYIGIKTFELLKGISNDIQVSIYSDNVNKLSQVIIDDFTNDTGIKVSLYQTHHLFHDRFILIDDNVLYISGPSSKDAGNSIAVLIEIYNEDIINFIKTTIVN